MEYGVAARLVTFGDGDLLFNVAGADGFKLTGITGMGAQIAAPLDPRAQRDGVILHRFLRRASYPVLEGYIKVSTGSLTTRRTYLDELLKKTESLMRNQGRYQWTPSGSANDRTFDCKLFEPVEIPSEEGFLKRFRIPLVTGSERAGTRPYAREISGQTYQQTTTTILAGNNAVINNAGNTYEWPVLKIKNAGATARVENTTYSEAIEFDALSGISGATYVEVDTYRETAYRNGSGANELGKLDQAATTFWYLRPGNNTITVTGCDVDVLWNNAWVT